MQGFFKEKSNLFQVWVGSSAPKPMYLGLPDSHVVHCRSNNGPITPANGVLFDGSIDAGGVIYAMDAVTGRYYGPTSGATVYGSISGSNGGMYVCFFFFVCLCFFLLFLLPQPMEPGLGVLMGKANPVPIWAQPALG